MSHERKHRGRLPGGGACQFDRCCPNLGVGSGVSSRDSLKKKGPAQGTASGVWPGNGAQTEAIPQSISFRSLAASIPRWILATRTRFACYLAKTFHIQCGGSAPSSAVFPIPLADFNVFRGGGPKLSSRRWLTLLRKRLLHILIVALNYLHDGFRGADLVLLGRRPNDMQRAIHKRLWSLLAACDAPGVFPLSPGRSGGEFIARLRLLEDFAKSCPSVSEQFYGDGPKDFEKPVPVAPEVPKSLVKKAREDVGEKQLDPYRPLDVSRLKLTGRGGWNLADHLNDELWLPFVEPAILRHSEPLDWVVGPNFELESKEENLALAKLWSAQGLLSLSKEGAYKGCFSRVFNNLKNETSDRMIGDRRLMNGAERSIRGPSKFLPGGYMMTSLHCPRGCTIYGIVTDRKDFYHQASVSRARAASNCLPFSYPAYMFKEDKAYDDLKAHLAGLRGPREKVGDDYKNRRGAKKRRALLLNDEDLLYPNFASLFQGDHLGVEYALSSHASLLADGGLLKPERQVRSRHAYPAGPVYEGLVIDDYFALECKSLSDHSPLVVGECLEAAQQIYDRHGVLGSPEKDVKNSQHFTVVGAEIDSSEKARSRKTVLVGSPVMKRLSLIALTLRAAQLPIISRGLASRLAGSWTCTLMFRRCLVSVLGGGLYQYGVIGGRPDSEVLELPRCVAEEVVLASIFGLVAVSNIQVPYASRIYATDASMQKGAVVSREIPEKLAEAVWLGGDKRGAYTKLDNPFRSALRLLGEEFEEIESHEDAAWGASFAAQREDAKIPFLFDFCEICGGSGVVSAAAINRGLVVMPPIELSDSENFDLQSLKLIEWLCYMLQTGKLKSIMCEPPCTSFSPAAHPCVRSYKEPRGFDLSCYKTWLGNLLAFRCFFLCWVARNYNRPSLLEQPFLSKMAWLSIWPFLMQRGFSQTSIASCAFGSPHLKKFRLLSYRLDSDLLSVQCQGGHKHVRIEGALTKASAVYVPRLADRFALVFAKALKSSAHEESQGPGGAAIESVVLNDILMTGRWSTDLEWFWKTRSHINILESHSYLALLKKLVIDGGDIRYTALLDSRVAKCSHAKGRSSSRALTPSLQKAAALQVAGGLYGSLGFAPTRLNVADDPTREQRLRDSSRRSAVEGLTIGAIQKLHTFQFQRPLAGWLRLVILIGVLPPGLQACYLPDDHQPLLPDLCGFCSGALFAFTLSFVTLSLGFYLLLRCSNRLPTGSASSAAPPKPQKPLKVCFGTQWIHRSHCPLVILLCFRLCHGVLLPVSSAADRSRAERRQGTQLFTDRVLKPATRSNRDNLLAKFDEWTRAYSAVSVVSLLEAQFVDADRVANLLVDYGRSLYYAGRPYGVYSETINAVTSKRGSLRRSLGLAWDLAFSWVADEPASHHPAMPRSVLLALCSLAILWTWVSEAGLFLLAWCGLLRIGEVLNAKRRDLILPPDGAPGFDCALLRITTPKTRGRTARHQSARVDQSDVVEFLTIVFGRLQPDQPLWPMSSSTLRKRLNMLQAALGLPTVKSHESCPYDLPGGLENQKFLVTKKKIGSTKKKCEEPSLGKTLFSPRETGSFCIFLEIQCP